MSAANANVFPVHWLFTGPIGSDSIAVPQRTAGGSLRRLGVRCARRRARPQRVDVEHEQQARGCARRLSRRAGSRGVRCGSSCDSGVLMTRNQRMR
jgi:hypothetical protein